MTSEEINMIESLKFFEEMNKTHYCMDCRHYEKDVCNNPISMNYNECVGQYHECQFFEE